MSFTEVSSTDFLPVYPILYLADPSASRFVVLTWMISTHSVWLDTTLLHQARKCRINPTCPDFSQIEPRNLLQLIGSFLESLPLSRKSQVSHRTQKGPHQYFSQGGNCHQMVPKLQPGVGWIWVVQSVPPNFWLADCIVTGLFLLFWIYIPTFYVSMSFGLDTLSCGRVLLISYLSFWLDCKVPEDK